MSFGNNVLFYRKKYGITQEQLAEKMEVTRQTVSRWETESAFPETEKLIRLCDLFHCDMETLVRGDAAAERSQEYKANIEAYDRHMNIFTAQITSGVCLILAGISLMLFLVSFGVSEVMGTVVFFCFLTVAVAIFVAGGIAHGNFMRENPKMEKYPPERVRAFRRKMPYLISGATALVFIGVIACIAMTYRENYAPSGFTVDAWENFAGAMLLSCISVAAGIFVYSGMQSGKYDVKSYNRECLREGYTEEFNADMGMPFETSEQNRDGLDARETEWKRAVKGERISSAICGAVMLTATAIYILLGFLGDFWHPGWVVFPVGGVICGIVSCIVQGIYGKK